nr:hypothetical protein [Tanacetum cinerariifolium]
AQAVVAPGPQGAIGLHPDAVPKPSYYLGPVGSRAYPPGRIAPGERVESELAVGISAPGPQRTIGAHAQAQIIISADALPVGCVAHLHGVVAAGAGPVAELPRRVLAPAPEGAVLPDGQRIPIACRHLPP